MRSAAIQKVPLSVQHNAKGSLLSIYLLILRYKPFNLRTAMLLLLFLSNVQPQRGLHARGDRDVEKSHFLTFCSEKTDKYVKTPRFCAVFSVLHLSSTHSGPRWEIRTPDIWDYVIF